jgi:hypothetical protein
MRSEHCHLHTRKRKENFTDRLFPKMGECREVLGGGPALPSKL